MSQKNQSNTDNAPIPAVSIITVCFNAESTIVETMQSVSAQTSHDYEHIIMDGRSHDATITRVEGLKTVRTRIFSSPDNGIYDAMNKALGVARGRYVLFLNSGDSFYDDDTLARFIDAAADSPDVVYGQTVLVDTEGNILGPRHLTAPETLTAASFANGMVVCHQAFMVRRQLAPQYNLRYRYSADYEWCIRCLQQSRNNRYLGDSPVIRYLSQGVTTANHRASLKERLRIMCAYYGTLPTLARHVKFAWRYALRRKHSANKQ